MSNFIQDCITGDALTEDIDDYIDNWHDGDTTVPLHTYLGMSKKEFDLFVKDQSLLPIIVTAHKEQVDFLHLLNNEITAMAARSDNQLKSKKLNKWLKEQGLWDQ